MPWQDDMNCEALGSNPGAGKKKFSHEISIEVYLYDYLVVEFYIKHVWDANVLIIIKRL